MADSIVTPEQICEEVVRSHLEAFCQDIDNLWQRSDHRYRVIRRNRLHPALRSNGYGMIDLAGIGLQKIGGEEEAERAATDIESRGSHAVEWPVREWLRRGRKLENEIYVVRERDSRAAVGLIGYKRDVECDVDDDQAEIFVTFDLSAIYIAPKYSGMGLATALFQPILLDQQAVIDHTFKSYLGIEKKCRSSLAVVFELTGQAESSGGAACARSLGDALQKAVRSCSRNRRERALFRQKEPVRDFFDYGDEDLWRDRMIDGTGMAA